MILKKAFYSLIALGFSIQLYAQKTEIVYLSGTDAANTVKWDFYCTDGQNSNKWDKIEVPSNWELQGFGTYNYGHDWKSKDKKLGLEHGLYQYTFDVALDWKGNTVNIVFDGSMTDTKVKINGVSAGTTHQGGFTRFKYDIAKLLKYGQANLLEVDVAKQSENESINRAERQADFWIFGGIYRPVFLEILPKTHMSRTAVNAKADGSLHTLIAINNPKSNYTVTAYLYDLEGNKMDQKTLGNLEKGISERYFSTKFNNIESWHPERPTLYDLKFELKRGNTVVHEVTERIGFRTVELRKHDGFYVNGEKVIFKGVNRHSFWPETGRSLSEKNHLEDIGLMKEMNMNAVRMSHYVPDKRFLELCDSLGIFVLDEITGWQDGYDTIVGPKMIKEVILKDENHPSVIIWDHGNEGGWDFANEKWIHTWDIQKRPVIYPWLLRNGVDTGHYPEYNYATGRFVSGNDPFMATELLHGLYDGGLGAGLDEYWRNYETSPLFAGGFLWAFSDEAVLRTDKSGKVFDGDGHHAPDGILGPHREKEASFYTIKEVWSPVQVEPVTINKEWNGRLILKNKYIYTNLSQCSFSWRALKTDIGDTEKKLVGSGNITGPDAQPGTSSKITIDCSEALQIADIFEFTAKDYNGQELYTWSWPVIQPHEKAKELIQPISNTDKEIEILEIDQTIGVSTSGVQIVFNKKDGTLNSVKNSQGKISISGGPVPAGSSSQIISTKWEKDKEGNFLLEVLRNGYPEQIIWKFFKNGLLQLEASPLQKKMEDIDYLGISFVYPEEKCTGAIWMGRGPYRVWKNRIKGSNFGVWEKQYNNTVTGETFNNLIYPEFKGYHGNLYWIKLNTTETPFTVISETPNLYFLLFSPTEPEYATSKVSPPFPKGNLSFLYDIPAIGTKFKDADKLGPKSQMGFYSGRTGDENYPIKLWFDFRAGN
tara:strand:- start:4421 stop:7228 length:2808 start_codon:yes stop_codon:yes gene_type:complete